MLKIHTGLDSKEFSPRLLRIHDFGTLLYDLEQDAKQEKPLEDPEVEKRMVDLLIRGMEACDAPPEQYERLGLR